MGMFNKTRMIALGLTLLLATACASVYRNHGFNPLEEDLANVIVGVDTRASVEETLGVPTTGGVNNADGMYYVSSRWRHFGAAAPKPISREIVAISFDQNEVVSNISRYGLEDGKVVVLSRRVTAGGAKEISFIRQLMGNIGRINAGDLIGQP